MKQETIKQAALGVSADPWRFLQTVGAEALSETVALRPAASSESEVEFIDRSEVECLSEGLTRASLTALRFEHSPEVFDEILRLTGQFGKAFPKNALSFFLETLKKHEEDVYPCAIDDIRTLLGPAGQWTLDLSDKQLFKRDPSRVFASCGLNREKALDDAVDRWNNGRPAERMAAFKTLRRLVPDRARDLLREGFASLKPDDKCAALKTLRQGLDESDVPFLEEVAYGKKPAGRDVAFQLLALFPTTRYADVMRERAAKIVDETGTWNFNAFEGYEAELKREGFAAFNPEGFFELVLARIPLGFWEERFGMAPIEIARRYSMTSREYDALYKGWARSFTAFGGPKAWADVFLELIPYSLDLAEKNGGLTIPGWSDPFGPCSKLCKALARYYPEQARRMSYRARKLKVIWNAIDDDERVDLDPWPPETEEAAIAGIIAQIGVCLISDSLFPRATLTTKRFRDALAQTFSACFEIKAKDWFSDATLTDRLKIYDNFLLAVEEEKERSISEGKK